MQEYPFGHKIPGNESLRSYILITIIHTPVVKYSSSTDQHSLCVFYLFVNNLTLYLISQDDTHSLGLSISSQRLFAYSSSLSFPSNSMRSASDHNGVHITHKTNDHCWINQGTFQYYIHQVFEGQTWHKVHRRLSDSSHPCPPTDGTIYSKHLKALDRFHQCCICNKNSQIHQ